MPIYTLALYQRVYDSIFYFHFDYRKSEMKHWKQVLQLKSFSCKMALLMSCSFSMHTHSHNIFFYKNSQDNYNNL